MMNEKEKLSESILSNSLWDTSQNSRKSGLARIKNGEQTPLSHMSKISGII